ncbi:MAG: hypothetical protein V5A43_08665 [Haloarculaceae archaeon]
MLFEIHRSRSAETNSTWNGLPHSTASRWAAYATVGLYAWVNAAEGLCMLGPLAVVVLPTAPRRDF